MFRKLMLIAIKIYVYGRSCKYAAIFVFLLTIHELLHMKDVLIPLYALLSLLFIVSAFYADNLLLYQVKEGLTICGAKRDQVRVVLYTYAALLSLTTLSPQSAVLIYYGLSLHACILELLVLMTTFLLMEIYVRLGL